MNIYLNDIFSIDNVIFPESTKNTVMNTGSFIRTIYSTNSVILNNLIFLININNISYNNGKIYFNSHENQEVIDKLVNIEYLLLNKLNHNYNNKTFTIREHLGKGNIKVFTENISDLTNLKNINLIVKISGIWVNNNNYGLICKYIY